MCCCLFFHCQFPNNLIKNWCNWCCASYAENEKSHRQSCKTVSHSSESCTCFKSCKGSANWFKIISRDLRARESRARPHTHTHTPGARRPTWQTERSPLCALPLSALPLLGCLRWLIGGRWTLRLRGDDVVGGLFKRTGLRWVWLFRSSLAAVVKDYVPRLIRSCSN